MAQLDQFGAVCSSGLNARECSLGRISRAVDQLCELAGVLLAAAFKDPSQVHELFCYQYYCSTVEAYL